MTKVFLSYRRSDSEDTVGRIYEHLIRRFGIHEVFRDVQSIHAGADYAEAIHDALAGSQAVVVVIGKRWLSELSNDGRRRIDLETDLVRREIETALDQGKSVVPVLVGGADMPEPSALPTSIRGLASRQALKVRSDPDFAGDMARLIQALEANTEALRKRPQPMAPPHQLAALPLHILIVCVFGLLALTSIGGGMYAISTNATSPTTLNIMGAQLTTGHVGVAFVGIGFIIAFLAVRAVLSSQRELAGLPWTTRRRRSGQQAVTETAEWSVIRPGEPYRWPILLVTIVLISAAVFSYVLGSPSVSRGAPPSTLVSSPETTTEAPVPDFGTVVLQEHFEDNKNDWVFVSDKGRQFGVERGHYYMDSETVDGNTSTISIPLTDESDYQIRCRVTKRSGVNTYFFGLVWGVKDPDNYYVLSITGDGRIAVARKREGAFFDYYANNNLINPHVKQGDATNSLIVRKDGKRVTFFVNDHQVHEIAFERPFGTGVGFLIYNKLKLEFDDLVVTTK